MNFLILELTGGMEWLALLPSYLLGAIPFGWVAVRMLHGKDLRQEGSGNIGATNAMRILGKPLGVVCFLLDFGKGFVPVALFATWFAGDPEVLPILKVSCGAAAVCGHVWPIYLGFKGGKAVATGCGGIVAIDPMIAVIGGVAWLVVLITTRYVGLASMLMGVSWPIAAFVRAPDYEYGLEVALATGALAILILWRHRANMGRMLRGEESRIGKKSSEPKTE
ncbi:MAG: glycerol-3-phosphate acyltransferase PlsY [Planctomycetota bacterium]|jgi:glycerol-3-phosphate acyltransferase PlsY